MTDRPIELDRRTLLVSATGLAAIQFLPDASALAAPVEAAAKPGEFDFLTGSWRIHHRRLKAAEGNEWDEFPGEATCWSVLAGAGSIEELRIPARNFSGLGIRLIDVEKRIWTDFWVNARSGVLSPPPLTGSFKNGVGTFTAEDTENGHVTIARGVWDRITKKSCRWHQAESRDGGKTWKENWFMDWTKV
jgi:hypothetical protein